MAVKIITWNEEKASQEVIKRYRDATRDRSYNEPTWRKNELAVYRSSNNQSNLSGAFSLDASLTDVLGAVDQSGADVNTAYTMKNLRFIHAQMSSNPPTVAIRPQTSDQDDQRKADAADRIVRWALRKYALQERQDRANLSCLLYGTGFLKTIWDSTKGDILSADMESGELEMEGDIDITVPFIWNVFLDPDAKTWDQTKWVIEKIYMDYEEACARWPEKADELKQARIGGEGNSGSINAPEGSQQTEMRDAHYNSVCLLEYWETGLPTNGYLGRYCITTVGGAVVEKCRPNPFRFKTAGAVRKVQESDLSDEEKERRIEKLPEKASLPYHYLSDIDVSNSIWGKSAVEFSGGLQDNLNRLDTARLDNIEAHGVARMVLPEVAGIAEDSLSNTPWDVVKVTGNQGPFYVSPPQLMPEMSNERNNYIQGINDVMGVNESMMGQQSRETSSASMQYATNQGNMIRHRLFNKYVACVESVYRAILNLTRKHWNTSRIIHVIGKEQALEAIDVQGMDIDGGYDVAGEYGVTLSLDPITRQQQILSLQPMFEKAGLDTRQLIKKLRLNDMEGIFSDLELAGHRQKEIFDEMIASNMYIAPEEQMDHANMIAWAMRYFMTQEFTALPSDLKALLKQHNKERAQLAAQEASGGAAPSNQGPGEPPGPTPGGAPAGPVPTSAEPAPAAAQIGPA